MLLVFLCAAALSSMEKNAKDIVNPEFAEVEEEEIDSTTSSEPSTPTPEFTKEGKITRSGVIAISSVCAIGVVIIIVGAICFKNRPEKKIIEEQNETLIN